MISKDRVKKLKIFHSNLNHLSKETGKINFENKFCRRYKGCKEYFWKSGDGMKLFILRDNKLIELI